MLPKISKLDSAEEWCWDNKYERETTDQLDRVLIGCNKQEILLILSLCKDMEGPFYILYVLLVSRAGNESGRYQLPHAFSYDELEYFLYEHQEYFEQDGRHHIWVASTLNEGQFIFDHHNFVYGYGDVDRYIEVAKSLGFSQGTLEIPCPHTHNYHHEYDDEEESLLKQFEWLHFPLEEDDEQ